MSKFIMTKDLETAEKLINSGLTLLSDNNNTYVFLNNGKLPMRFEDNTKIFFTDIMYF